MGNKNYNGTARVKTQVVTNSNSGIKENGLLIAQPKEQLFAKLKQLERSLRELSKMTVQAKKSVR